MNCTNQFIHTIQQGDTLYTLAQRFNTTVEKLLELNPGVEIYNLQIGTGLIVCPGEGAVVTPIAPITPPPVTPVPPIAVLPPIDVLRELLLQLVRWIRQNFGETQFRTIIEAICQEWCKPATM